MSKGSTYMRNVLIAAFTSFVISLASANTYAAAFALKEQSTTYLGYAFSGTASTAADASTNFYNPAGLVLLKTNQVVASAVYIKGSIKLYDASARDNNNTLVSGNNPTYPKSNGFIPGMHLAWRINPKFSVGFSVCAPFGLGTKYSNTDIARYMATESKLATIDLTPSVAYKFNDQLSAGIGFDAMHVKAKLYANTQLGLLAGYSNNNASGWAYGYHLGVIYKPTAMTNMGLAYFSRYSPRVSGPVQTANLPGAARTSLTANVKLPDRIVYSITHKYDDTWSAMADIEWDHWSVLKFLQLNYNTGSSSTELFNYKNAFRFAFGGDYKYSEALLFKAGISYEQTPVTNTYRSARLPDSNRYWFALGLKYAFNRNVTLDAAYSYIYFVNAPIAQSIGTQARRLFGNYRSSANLVGVQLAWNFV